MHDQPSSTLNAASLRIGLAVSRYHAEITDPMCKAAATVFAAAGGNDRNLHIAPAAGAFELTAVCRAMATLLDRNGRPAFDALAAIGCIIGGETNHNQYLAQSVVQGLTAIIVQTGIPISFGVLTCNSIDQARMRSSSTEPSTNKGAEAMAAAIQSATIIKIIQTSRAFR